MKTHPLKRHPDGRKLITAALQENSTNHMLQIMPPDGLFMEMGSADLEKMLTPIVGKRDRYIEGKYKRAATFAFEANGEVIVAVTETGDRGSGWYWLTQTPQSWAFGNTDPEPLQHFWPQFLLDLNAALGSPAVAENVLSERALKRIQAEEAQDQMQKLDEAIPAAAAPPRARMR